LQITNGKVSFTRSVRPADYEKKEATVELSFAVGDEEDAASVVEAVGRLAQEKALALVGLRPTGATPSVPTATQAPPTSKETSAANMNAEEGKKRGPGRPPKVSATVSTPTGPDISPAPGAIEPTEDDIILGGVETRPEVTDDMLSKALNRKSGALTKTHQGNANIMLRKLIAEFVGPPPATSRMIPQARRQEFLDKMEALT